MRMTVWLDPNEADARVRELLEEVRRLQGVKAVQLEAPAATLADPSDLELEERSRIYLVNAIVGETVAAIARNDAVQTAAMATTLILCRTVFEGSDTFYEALRGTAPDVWKGKRGSERKIYSSLKQRLDKTVYPLATDGYYGFLVRMRDDQREDMIRKVEARTAKARATREARARAQNRPDASR